MRTIAVPTVVRSRFIAEGMHAQSKTGNESRRSALQRVVATYESALLRYATRLVGDPTAAEDVVQNAFVKLIRRWRGDPSPSPYLSAWLYRVTHNEAVDYLRKESRRRELHARHAEEQEVTHPHHPNRGDSDRADAATLALNRLDERERLLVVLKVYEQKSYKEIAEIAGISVGNVGYILHQAMKKMARHLREGKAT